MPIVYNRSSSMNWSSKYGGLTREIHRRDGFRTLPGESKSQVLRYFGEHGSGYIVKDSTVGGGVFDVGSVGNSQRQVELRNASMVPSWGIKTANKAYSRFKDKALGDSSQLGVAAAEARQSFGMIADRSLGLYHAYKDLRKGKFRQALKRLSVEPKRKHRNKIRSAAHEASGLWLEYWFGWSASVNDIFTACSQLSDPLPSNRFSGSSRLTIGGKKYTSVYRNEVEKGLYRCKTGGTVVLVNPNLFLASQLGLVNPLAIAWELVPFSFVVDWFVDVGSYIEGYSDFVGTDILDSYRSFTYKTQRDGYSSTTPQHIEGRGVSFRYYETWTARYQGLYRPLPTWPRVQNFGQSVTRAASAVSLLTKLFIQR